MSRQHFGARLHDYTELGYRTLAFENELLRVEVLVDKGTDIVSFLHKPSDTDFLWRRPSGLRHRKSVSDGLWRKPTMSVPLSTRTSTRRSSFSSASVR